MVKSSPQAQKFMERDNSGKMEVVYNEHLPPYKGGSRDGLTMRTEIAIYPGFLTEGYRYMYEKLSEKSLGIYMFTNYLYLLIFRSLLVAIIFICTIISI